LINKVYKQKQLVAIIIDFYGDLTSSTFFTDDESPLQVGMILKGLNQPVNAHRHNFFERKVLGTSEFLFVLEGNMTLTIFDENFEDPEFFNVNEGFGVLLLGGAHAIDFEESTKLIEVKQGPYTAENDKVYLAELDS
jgi:hypothetical protein